jgi:uncharacterized protein YggE
LFSAANKTLIVQAMQDAIAKADIVASAAGMKVVVIRSINLIQPPPTPIPLAKQSLAANRSQTNSYYVRSRRGYYQYGCHISNSMIIRYIYKYSESDFCSVGTLALSV